MQQVIDSGSHSRGEEKNKPMPCSVCGSNNHHSSDCYFNPQDGDDGDTLPNKIKAAAKVEEKEKAWYPGASPGGKRLTAFENTVFLQRRLKTI